MYCERCTVGPTDQQRPINASRLENRVDIPETSGHWETAYVARSLPLVRGWIRQVDTQLNGATFYHGTPSP